MIKLNMLALLAILFIGISPFAQAKDCGCKEQCADIQDPSDRFACLANCQLKCDGLSQSMPSENTILIQLAQLN